MMIREKERALPVPVNRVFIVTLVAGVFRPHLDPGPIIIYSNG